MARSLARAVLLTLAATAAGAPEGHAAPPPTKVYVFTEPPKGTTPTEEEQGRLDSVRDLTDALRGNKKITIASEATGSQVQVEVTSRERKDAGGGFGGTAVTPLGETLVRIRAKFGASETEIKGVGQGYWSRAAKDAAERLVRWILRVSEKS